MASRRLEDTVPELQQKVPLIIAEYNQVHPERELRVICTLRSTQEQQDIYAVGRTVPPIGNKYVRTKVDGVTKFSKHNPDPLEPKAKAVDFGVFIGGKYMDHDEFYYDLLELARKNDLVSGLDFFETGLPLEARLKKRDFKDSPHVEVRGPIYTPQGV